MATTESSHRLRPTAMEAELVTMAVTVVMDRVGQLTTEGQGDLIAILNEYPLAMTEEDRIGIRDTMVEILDGRAATVERADLSDAGIQAEKSHTNHGSNACER